MDVPGIVESALGDEDVAAEISLGGENVLYVTATRTLIYQSEGFLSDESVDEYAHEASRMTVKEGRRKTRISLEYSLDGTKEFTVPSNVTERVLHPVLAGVLNASGVTSVGETVTQTFRLDQLTLVVTSERLVKHVGGAVWDEDYEEYHFADVTGLDFEDGSVATQLVLEVDGRPERVKISNERAAEVKEFLQRALFSYYDVRSLDELNDAVRPEEDDGEERPSPVDFGEGVDPLDAGNTVQPDEDGSGDEAVGGTPVGDVASEDVATGDATPEESTDPLSGTVGQIDAGAHRQAESEVETAERPPQTQNLTDPQGADPNGPDSNEADPREAESNQGPESHRDQPLRGDAESGAAESGAAEPGAAEAGAETRSTAPDAVDEGAEHAAERSQGSAADPATESTDGVPVEADDIADAKFEEAGFEPATTAGDEELVARIDALEQRVDRQNELLERQQHVIQQLVDELSRGR